MNGTEQEPRITVSVVVPIYNNADCLDELCGRLAGPLSAARIENYEVIFVDDGSQDDSRAVLRRLCRQEARIKLIGLTRNFGQQLAITAGFDCSRGDAVLVMDGDLQDPPEVIPEFLAKWREGYDVVYGVRLERQGGPRPQGRTASPVYRGLRRAEKPALPLGSWGLPAFRMRAEGVVNSL